VYSTLWQTQTSTELTEVTADRMVELVLQVQLSESLNLRVRLCARVVASCKSLLLGNSCCSTHSTYNSSPLGVASRKVAEDLLAGRLRRTALDGRRRRKKRTCRTLSSVSRGATWGALRRSGGTCRRLPAQRWVGPCSSRWRNSRSCSQRRRRRWRRCT